jgi:type II secretory pathway pseudopilin PulG
MRRLRQERGQGLIELVVTMVVISLALLALAASYDTGFLSLHHSASKLAAANLAQKQLELYAAIPYASLGLDTTTLASVRAVDTTYTSDDTALVPSGADKTVSCGTSSYCLPVQCTPAATCAYPVTLSEDPVGSDGKHYKVETFIRTVSQTVTGGGSVSEIDVTVIVRDPNQSGSPMIYEATTAFDCAMSTGNCT